MKRKLAAEGGVKDEWRTPPALFEFCDQFMGWMCGINIGLDAAANDNNTKFSANFITKEQDSLVQNWSDFCPKNKGIFINPPFSRVYDFVGKIKRSSEQGLSTVAILPGTWCVRWMHQFVFRSASHILVPNKRLAYLDCNGDKQNSPNFETIIVLWDALSHPNTPRVRPLIVKPDGTYSI